MKYSLYLLVIIISACSTTMNKDLTIKETEALSGLSIPEKAKNFSANKESAMNLFVYARFELGEEELNQFFENNKLNSSDNLSDDFSAYNQNTSWWKFREEMKDPSFSSYNGTKGKWRTSLNVACSKVGDKTLVYVLYYEEA